MLRSAINQLRLLIPAQQSESAAPDLSGGAFGRWIVDKAGLPAYLYEMDQYRDLRARYPNSEGLDRRDHWHLVGNHRVNAMTSNDGTVQVYLGGRGGIILNWIAPDDAELPSRLMRLLRQIARWLGRIWNRIRQSEEAYTDASVLPRGVPSMAAAGPAQPKRPPAAYAFGGGFGYVDDGEAVWSTAFRYRPDGIPMRRVFGMGYAETEFEHRGLRVSRKIYAPQGDAPAVLADVQITNLRDAPVTLRYYEYWDVNVYQLRLQWLRTGLAAPRGDTARLAINNRFAPGIYWFDEAAALRFHQTPPPDAPPLSAIDPVDWHPPDVFLADLSGMPDAYYTDKVAFFGSGGARQPDAILARRQGELGAPSTDAMPYCMVLRRDLTLAPGEQADLRFAYGAADSDKVLDFLTDYHMIPALEETLAEWQRMLVTFRTPGEPFLEREMAWHTYNLLASTVYNNYYETYVTPQGSAYLYLHGADGAPRDQALFAIPLVYIDPAMARANLHLIMRLMDASGAGIPYAFSGYGYQDDAGIHAEPSDLDLFFFLALGEYLAATGDFTFLHEKMPFYPLAGDLPGYSMGTPTVLAHVHTAMAHLQQKIGLGDYGLIRIGDGDWSDGIVFSSALQDGPFRVSFENSKRHGESVPNSQMALYVLPLLAAILEPFDPALAVQLRELVPGLRTALQQRWTGHWYQRAILRDIFNRPVMMGDDAIDLEAQPWAMIARLVDADQETRLIDSIQTHLDAPSPIGATLTPGGMVWPAVSQLLTWGYAFTRQDLAWQSLKRHTFAAHAAAYPNVWFNVWSGPDGINGPGMKNPGGTWASPVTPMTDFPAMNANQDAMALLGLLRVCGIQPVPDGLRLAPQAPPESFVLDTRLLRLEVSPGRIAGEYRAIVNGTRNLYVVLPAGAVDVTAEIDKALIAVNMNDAVKPEVMLPLTFKTGQQVAFQVKWRRETEK